MSLPVSALLVQEVRDHEVRNKHRLAVFQLSEWDDAGRTPVKQLIWLCLAHMKTA